MVGLRFRTGGGSRWLAAIAASFFVGLVAAGGAYGFGTLRVGGFGTLLPVHNQSGEHERITRHALSCASPTSPGADLCYEPLTLDEIAGSSGTFGSVGIPDALILPAVYHCDGGDYLDPSVVRNYPRTKEQAQMKIAACRAIMGVQLNQAVRVAAGLLDSNGQVLPDQATLSCGFPAGVSGGAKCNVLESFGMLLHTAQDFYSHSNWVDAAAPGPIGVRNPPGLGNSGRAPYLNLRGAQPFPEGLISGCFDEPDVWSWIPGALGLPEVKYCNYGFVGRLDRVKHDVLNKDEGTIDPEISPNGTTQRGRGGNFGRAVSAAIDDSADKWATLRRALIDTYGSRRGTVMICAITRDDPVRDCKPPPLETVAIVAGHDFNCAVTQVGAVRCWGSGAYGKLGSGATDNLMDQPGEVPSVVPLGEEATSLAAGWYHACALTRSGAVRCWGFGLFGQLGSGATDTLMDQPGEVPSVVPLGEAAVAVSAGANVTCALTQSGAVRCWGYGGQGQLGNGAFDKNLMDQPGETPSIVPLGEPAVAVSVSKDHQSGHVCAVTQSGAVRCWGNGSAGQLGNGATRSLMDQPGESPSVVPLGEAARSVATGILHTCAVTQSGAVRCWGFGFYGQLGSGATDNLMDQPGESPSSVPLGGEAAVAITGGPVHNCAVTESGAVRCWGYGATGVLGSGATDWLMDQPGESPSIVSLGESVVAVGAGEHHTCALTESGVVRCWGQGLFGKLGNGSTNNLMDQPGESPSTVPLG